jgi:signal transduction histidine kinase
MDKDYKRFRAALDASSSAFIVFDENKKVFFVSKHYYDAYPKSAKKLVKGLDVKDAFILLCEEDGILPEEERYKEIKKFWMDLGNKSIEFVLSDGRVWTVKSASLPDNQGTIVTTTDITNYVKQRKMLEKKTLELEDSLIKEKEAGKIQKQFIDMVSHEFRTPLTIIDGNAQIIQRRGDLLEPETLEKRSQTIRSSVSRLINMMEGILSSNMLKTGKLEVVHEDVDLKKLISELCDDHAHLSQKAEINCDIKDLPDALDLDRKIMTLIISNLLSNAIKFAEGAPVVNVRSYVEGDTLYIIVEDNGPGIPDSEKSRIFGRYYRTSAASTIAGSGIGLNLVKDLIDLYEGQILVEDAEGETGTKFTVKIPC